MKQTVDIILITYNSKAFIEKCLNSIFQNQNFQYKFNIVVIDNNSSDNTLELIKYFSNRIKIITNNTNIGFAAACNQGLSITNGKYIFLLNPDTILINDAIKIFIDFLEKGTNKNVWCVGSQLINENNKLMKSFGRYPNLIDVFLEQLGIKTLFRKIPIIKNTFITPYLKDPVIVPFILGCNMFIRRNIFEKVKLFNENFFLNYEEVELAWRAEKAGYKCMILPEAKILHYSGRSFEDLKNYNSHLWYGQLMFFKLTQSKFTFYAAKILHLSGSFMRAIFRFDKFYWIHIKNILSIKL